MPPLRAAFGMDVSQENRFDQAQQSLQFDMDRMLALASGDIPRDQMTERDMQLLQQYNMSMGFGGGIRDVAQQGGARIASALSPYVTRGREMLSGLGQRAVSAVDQFMPNLQGFRVAPLRGPDGGRIVVQGRENIVAGPGGMPATGAGTKFERASTLEVGDIPFTQAVRESMRTNPRGTLAAGTVGGGTTAAALMEAFKGRGTDISNIPPEQLAQTVDRINQIPNEFAQKGMSEVSPSLATINAMTGDYPIDLTTPFNTAEKPLRAPTAPKKITFPTLTAVPSKEEVKQVVAEEDKKQAPLKTRAERIKEEYATL
jgi:hypothetical protein